LTHCNRYFDPGRLTVIYDVGFGSSGKGKLGSYVMEHADKPTFAVNTFAPQAGHWVKLDDGSSYFYQSLNSCAYLHEKLEKLYIGPGAMIELPALLREIRENGVPPHKLGISPVVPILDPVIDGGFEQGLLGFDGQPLRDPLTGEIITSDVAQGTAKFGSTGHGVGSCNARRVLRRKSLRLARDVPELQQYLCDVPREISDRLDAGECGLLELAQGFSLSMMLPEFYPMTTSRNTTVAQGLSDCMLAPKYAGQVIGNLRTYPIRISSNKYVSLADGRHLTWAEVQSGVPHEVFEGNSGHWYPDQTELSWDELTRMAGSPTQIMEMTSVTKLPRRVATFSLINVMDAIRHNDTGRGHHLSINFANYVDHAMTNARTLDAVTPKFVDWSYENLGDLVGAVRFIGTGAETEATIHVPDDKFGGSAQPTDVGTLLASSARFDRQIAEDSGS
jgi:hypothetical protein